MNAASMSIEQKATITQTRGNVQLVRDGFFLPAQAGMILLPGDRVISDAASKAVIQFTGVKDALIIENGAAATFNLEVVEMDQPPQWIATNLIGEGVYFDGQQATEKTAGADGATDLFGMFGTTPAGSESTGYPVLESLVFLGATAAIYSDNENNADNTATTTSELGTGTNNGAGMDPDTAEPQPNPEPSPQPSPEPATGPLGGVLEPLTSSLEDLLLTLGTPTPVGSLQTSATQPTPSSIQIAQAYTAN
jgi:hypothetical protein